MSLHYGVFLSFTCMLIPNSPLFNFWHLFLFRAFITYTYIFGCCRNTESLGHLNQSPRPVSTLTLLLTARPAASTDVPFTSWVLSSRKKSHFPPLFRKRHLLRSSGAPQVLEEGTWTQMGREVLCVSLTCFRQLF